MAHKAVKGFLWDYAGLFFRKGGSFIVGVFLARLLGPRDFGVVSLMGFFTAISGSFMIMGFPSALILKKDAEEIHYSSVFWINLSVGFFLFFLFFFLSPFFAKFYDEPVLEDVIKVTSLTFIFNALNIVQTAKLSKKLNFRSQTKAQIISLIISGAIAILLAKNGYGLWSLVYYGVLSSIIYTCCIYYFEQWLPKFIFSLNAVKEIWKFASNMLISGMLNQFFEKLDVLFIGKFMPVALLGNYNRSQSFNTLITKFTSESIGKVSFPLLVNKNSNQEIINLNAKILGIISLVVFGLTGLIYLNADFIIITLFSEKWIDSVPILKIMILSAFYHPINSQVVSVIKAKGESGIYLRLEIVKNIMYLVSFLIGFFAGGLYGMMYGIFVFGVLATLLNIYFSGKVLNHSTLYQLKIILKYALIAFIPALIVIFSSSFLPEIQLIYFFVFKVILFSFLYLIGLIILRTQALKDLIKITNQLKTKKTA